MIRFVFALALVCACFSVRAEAGGCSSGACAQQVQAVYAAPVVQQFAFVPQVQAVAVQAYAAPVVQRQVIVQRQAVAYAPAQAVVAQPVVVAKQRARLFGGRQRSVAVQRTRVRGAASAAVVSY